MADEMKGTTGEGPYTQFSACSRGKTNCRYLDAVGKCIWENCFFDTAPATTLVWYFTCIVCGEVDAEDPAEYNAPVCKFCKARMLKAEKLPFVCIGCGRTIATPSKAMFSSICDECWDLIFKAAYYSKYGDEHKPS
jgi:hypothetical protein